MPSNTSKTNQQKCSPPKKSKDCKKNNARESLGEFDSSILDATNGHKLVDLIRKKKGLHVQTQKIFDDIPSQRPSLQIEIQRLDDNNETLRQPEKPPSAAACSSINAADAPPPKRLYVPKSPKRISIASPARPINIGRRTLLKEFEKAFLNESRFLPQTCSTPITSDVPGQINAIENDSVRADDNILSTPITVSSASSSVEKRDSMGQQLPINASNTETMMHALVQQNEMLNALAQSSGDKVATNKENPIPKSPGRMFTVECDISSGKITLSPAKSNQHHRERQPLLPKAQVKTPVKNNTKKLIATPEQRKLLRNMLGMGQPQGNSPQKIVESVQKTSKIPVFSKATPLPNLRSQHTATTATAELVEHFQNNSKPNCPVIVIPVNQTFNQAPPQGNTFADIPKPIRSPTPYEITSTIRDNVAQSSGSDNCNNNDLDKKAAPRVDSPASNGISSTTISNGEAFKGKVPEPPAESLRWDDIITDDSSSPDKSDSNSPSKNKRGRKLSKRRNSQKHHSTTSWGSKKLSVSNKCLDLRVRARRCDMRSSNSSKQSRQSSSKIDELWDKGHEGNSPRRSPRKTFTFDQQQRYEERLEILSQQSHSDFSTIDENSENNMPQRSNRNTLKIDEQREELIKILSGQTQEQRDEEHQQTMSVRSRDEQRRNLSAQQPQRKTFTIDKQHDEDHQQNSSRRSRRDASKIDEHRDELRTHLSPQRSQRKTFTIDEQQRHEERQQSMSNEELINILSGQTDHKTLTIDKQQRDEKQQRHEEHQQAMSVRSRDEQRGNLSSQQPQRKTFTIDEQRDENLSRRSRRDASKIDEHRDELRTHLSLQRSQRKTFTIDEQQRHEERQQSMSNEELINILSGQTDHKTLTIDKQQRDEKQQRHEEHQQAMSVRSRDEQRRNLSSQQPQRKTFTIDEQRDEDLSRRSRRDASKIDEHRDEHRTHLSPQRSQRKTFTIDEQQRHEERQQSMSNEELINILSGQTDHKTLTIDKQQRDEKQQRHEEHQQAMSVRSRDEQRRNLSSQQPQRKTFTIDEQRDEDLSRRSRRDASKIDEDRGERRTHLSPQQPQRKTFTIDEQQRNEELLQYLSLRPQRDTTKNHEHRDEQRTHLSPQRSQRKTSTIDKQLPADRQQNASQQSDKSHDEVLPPPVAFCDRSLSSIRKSVSFEKDELVDEVSSDKVSLEKLQRPAKVISKKKRNNKKTQPQHLVEYLEANKKVSKSKLLNVSKRKLYSKGNSDASSSSSDTTPEKIFKKNPVSPVKQQTLGKLPKQPRTSNKSAKPVKNNNDSKRPPTNEETSRSSSSHFDNERSTVSPENITAKSPARTSRQTNEHHSEHLDSQKETPFLSSSRLSSLHKNSNASPVRTSNQRKNEHSKAVDRSTEKDTPTISSSRHSNRNASPVKTSKQSTESVAIVQIPDPPPPKALPKRKYTKKSKTVIDPPLPQNEDNASLTTNSDNNNGGPRRSSRKTKPPSAYWSCPNSQYTHVSDIYAMLTAGKKPYFPESIMKLKTKKKKEPSKDDNLVANTNKIKSTSEKNTHKNKQKNMKKVIESVPEETNSTTEIGDMNEPETSHLAKQLSTTGRLSSKDTTTSHSKTKANKKSKKRQIEEELVIEEQNNVQNIPDHSVQLSTNSSFTDSSRTNASSRRTKSKKRQQPEEVPIISSDCPSQDDNNLSFHKRRLETISENIQEIVNPVQDLSTEERLSGSLMPPPATNIVVKKGKRSQKQQKQHKSFHTEHDKSIADVSSVHANELFEQLKNSSMNSSRLNSSNRTEMNSMSSNEQASPSLGNHRKELKNVSVRVHRMQLPEASSYVVNERNFDSGFTSMNSINPKKDILLDWIVQMLNNGKTTISSDEGLARLLKPNGCSSSTADELIFEEVEGVDFAFYNNAYSDKKFGYLRFKPKTRKRTSCAKKHELNFVLLGGTIRITINDQSFDMKNGDLTTIFIGTTYRIDNVSDDPALVMVIKS